MEVVFGSGGRDWVILMEPSFFLTALLRPALLRRYARVKEIDGNIPPSENEVSEHDLEGAIGKRNLCAFGVNPVLIVFAYIIPFYSSTEENPTGWAGSLAPLIALFTALIALLRSKLNANAKLFPSPDILIGLGSLFTAHLWLADAETKERIAVSTALPSHA